MSTEKTNPNRAAAVQPLAWGDSAVVGESIVEVWPNPGWIVRDSRFPDGEWFELETLADEQMRALITPLLPPPDKLPAGPEVTLEALALLPGAIPSGAPANVQVGSREIQLETGKLWIGICVDESGAKGLYCEWWTFDLDDETYLTGTADNYEARGRDHAKEGVLRQWLSQRAAIQEGVEQ